MDSPEFKGIEPYLEKDLLLRRLFEEYRDLERRVIKLEKRPFLTTEEEQEEHRLKKQRLSTKDQMMKILEKYRGSEK